MGVRALSAPRRAWVRAAWRGYSYEVADHWAHLDAVRAARAAGLGPPLLVESASACCTRQLSVLPDAHVAEVASR